jgi:lipopolysaccharide/colanic/teichoic acid biosynthesis glycosyltransferase
VTGQTGERAARRAGDPLPRPVEPRPPTAFAAWLGLSGVSGSRHRDSLLRRLLAASDWVALVGALCLATAATRQTDVATLFWAVLFSPTWILVVKLHGLYDNDHRRIRHSTLDELPALVSACALGTIALDGLLALSPAGPLAAGSAILVGVGTLIGAFALRAVSRFSWHRLTGAAEGVVVGHLVGFLRPMTERREAAPRELPALGSTADLREVAQRYAIERVVLVEQQMTEQETERLIEVCKAEGLALTFLPQHHGLLGPGIELNRLAELPVLDFRFSDAPWSTLMLKRALDLIVSATLLAFLSPLLLGIAALILVDSGRPVLFRQSRVGKGGKPFTMVKFRTMVTDAEDRLAEVVDLEKLDEPAFKIRDDPRVTRAGRFLRRTSLDELPQLLNVLAGAMSLVGPRPEEEAVVALYDERQRIRLAVKPGLTGPMQVYGRGDLSFEERLAMERDYLDNLSITGDLAILLRTPGAIIRGDGAY